VPDLFFQGSASGGKKEKPQNVQELMQKAASRAFGGGISGATAGVLQVHQKRVNTIANLLRPLPVRQLSQELRIRNASLLICNRVMP
jgi:hypothetical protein